MTAPDIPTEVRERVKGPLHEALHTLGPRIPNLNVGDCHCNLLAEVALDGLMPTLVEVEARGYQRAIDALRDDVTRSGDPSAHASYWAEWLAAQFDRIFPTAIRSGESSDE